jgi:hypothetical protein
VLTVARIHRTVTGERAFVCGAPAGGFVVVPEWMTAGERCVHMRLAEAPLVSLAALLELHTLLRSIPSAPDRHGRIGADVTDLMNRPQAWYFIRQTVDAAGILFEQDDRNNTAGIWVILGIGVPYSTGGPRPGV